MPPTARIILPQEKLRPLIITLVCTMLTGASYGFGLYLFPMVMPEILHDLKLSYSDAGVITAAAQTAPLFMIPLAGYLTGRVGGLRLIVFSQIFGAALLLALYYVQGFFSLLIVVLLMRGWPLLVWIPLVMVAAEHIEFKWRATMLTVASSGACFFVFVDGALSSYFLERHHWRYLWPTAALCCLVFGVSAWLGLCRVNAWEYKRAGRSGKKRSYGELLKWAKTRSGVITFVVFALTGLTFTPFQTYLASYLRDNLNLTIAVTGAMWSVMGIAGIGGGLVMGVITDRMGARIALFLTFFLAAVSAVLICMPITTAQVMGMAVCYGIAQAVIYGLAPAYMSKILAPESSVTAVSAGTLLLVSTAFFGNLLGGWSSEYFGSFFWLYLTTGLFFTMGALVSLGLTREQQRTSTINRHNGLSTPCCQNQLSRCSSSRNQEEP
ncbi:MFS transporter [Desulforhopalus singaporensis]|uniref:Predicted arabinose efflux permease, MFS family n=1 Tax=Desulforhopalus singaporensis TaxID=91360 RepID=A0A1H0TXA8_9BACT|nr:MFS transporter [Desulforhopalus singaporensis]SDP58574.1 Predicted arabinose efflux permease, MFS family [Desulforhopalus singaporensis]